MLLELWQVSSGHGEALKRVAIVDKPTEPPVEQFDPDIPVFRFDCPNFLGSFTDWIKQGEAATAHALLAPSVGGEHHATSP